MKASSKEVRHDRASAYLEMPGTTLKAEQVQRLCGVEQTICKAVLDAPVDAKFLCVTSGGAYARLGEGTARLRPAKARLQSTASIKALTKAS